MSNININMKSSRDWGNLAKAHELADILNSEDDFFLPEKLDDREPERFVFHPNNLEKFLELWPTDTGMLFLARRKPYPTRMIMRMFPQRFNEIMSGFDERYFKNEENILKLLNYAKRLYKWGTIDHGYICHDEDWNLKNYFGFPTTVTGGKLASTGGLWLEDLLPGIYWANFFGPIYVELFGREKFLTMPAYRKEELPDGGFLLLTSKTPLEYGRPEVRSMEQAIISHLGREAFFEKANPQKPSKAPKFIFEKQVVLVYDPISKFIPEVNSFIKEAPKLAEALRHRFSGELDYTPEGLNLVDDFILKVSYECPEPWTKDEGRRLMKELTAYYGEMLRQNLGGKWLSLQGSGSVIHPAIVFPNKDKQIEYPFTRVYKMWSEREREDGLVTWYQLLQSGQSKRIEQHLKKLFKR